MSGSNRFSLSSLARLIILASLSATQGCDSVDRAFLVQTSAAADERPEHSDLKTNFADAETSPDGGQRSEEREDNADEIPPGNKSPNARLGTIPNITLVRSLNASAQESKDVKELIRKLASIENPDFGLSSTMSGEAFLPIDGMTETGAMILMDHQLKSSTDLRKLVEWGPKALPFLIESLDDKTSTKLVMQHEGGFGTMEYTNELWGNPANSTESKILDSRRRGLGFNGAHVKKHTVTIGDVCLVAIGQIVGRPYQAVRYQPTACIMLNSPTHDANLCRQVREIWSSTDAAHKLFDSLKFDYATTTSFNGASLDGWDIGATLQVAASLRLLYYFRAESVDLIAERLDRLDVTATGPGAGSKATESELNAYVKQCLANGVRADEFVKATAWCEEPKIHAAMLRVFERAADPDVVCACMRSLGPDNSGKIRAKVSQMLDGLADESGGPFGDGYNLLVGLGKYGGAEAKTIFQKYLEVKSIVHCRAMCHVLRKVRSEWAAELLKSLLADQRKADGWTYAINPNQEKLRLPIRICDEAAETIAKADKRIHFDMRGTHADLDRQVKTIEEVLRDR